ncbi:MAG: sigma-54-dependent Fis family transcriptional regulator [Cycloclasticus sp.]|nr:sigma-54-dependent Fis family transcriptional regulator [Cycloclasticus sp.]MBQ0789663.1 sigma-54-dependent Fis family transcriptional regulator [Cycloclasticus sp.]
MKQIDVLIVEDDLPLQEAIEDTLVNYGYRTHCVENGVEALKALESNHARLVISDVQMKQMDGIQLLQELKSKFPSLPVLLMTAHATVEKAVHSIKAGAADYLTKPFEVPTLLKHVENTISPEASAFGELPSNDSCMQDIVALAGRVAKSEATVLIQGESGTGKEVISRFIHKNSNRNKHPFVAVNCAAIPENMLEAMLFGYEKGAFTGAYQSAPGKFEQAQGGTILLDEISEMNILLQAKLLRVLQEKEVERLGGRKTIALDVRVLATTNRNLREYVNEGKFREDLLYRINVFPIQIPPLRERKSDVLALAKMMIARHYVGEQSVPRLTPGAIKLLENHSWQGNVRELENVMQRALIMTSSAEIKEVDLIFELGGPVVETPTSFQANTDNGLNEGVKAVEDKLILETLVTANGSRKNTAERLGISARTLRYKIARMREAGIEIPA